MSTKTNITLYTAATPNGIKVPILLAELGLEYKVRRDTIPYNGQKQNVEKLTYIFYLL
jgi:glutathione S-transferase